MRTALRLAFGLLSGFVVAAACGGNDSSANDGQSAGQACAVADDCDPNADPSAIVGKIMCLDQVPGGYCTHLCTKDEDCCAADGECDGRAQVCAPFQSTGMNMCFLSCEAADLNGDDPDTYCHDYASDSFGCRSTGGGSSNRKVCA